MPLKIKKRYLFPLLLVGLFVVGPRAGFPPVQSDIPDFHMELDQLDPYLAKMEAQVTRLKPANASRIIWADSLRKTDYAIVYLHGFSASPVEGAPFHEEFAHRYGMNLYLPRLVGHGIDDPESFVDLSPEQWMASAREAIAIGKLLGEKLLLMSCSGSTLAVYLAAQNPEQVVEALMMYSPNFALESQITDLLTGPWGLQSAGLFPVANTGLPICPRIAIPTGPPPTAWKE